jgi:hypothetical protein
MKLRKITVIFFAAFLSGTMAYAQTDQGTPIPQTVDATSSATTNATADSRFLGFESKEAFHRFSGWTAGGTLLAAGIVGAVHAYGMMSTAHAYRDNLGITEFNKDVCPGEIAAVYGDPTQQALHWTHAGLLVAGESFYLANAITGSGFMGPLPPGMSKAKAHRIAFFTHAGLMAAEGVMGFFTSDALERGDHETFHVLLSAHAIVGLIIPATILGAGAIMD